MTARFNAKLFLLAVALILAPAATLAATPFEIIALPDTQFYSESYPSIFAAQTQWISNTIAAGGDTDAIAGKTVPIAFVTHLGDVTNSDTTTQWSNASAAMSLLDGTRPGGLVPYSVTRGNHDGRSSFAANYGTARYTTPSQYSWYGGSYDDWNHYQLFSAGGYDFLHLNIAYDSSLNADTNPVTAALTWAQTVISSYPNRQVILTTHDYLDPLDDHNRYAPSPGSTSNDRSPKGQAIWNALLNNTSTALMTLNGHTHIESQQLDTNAKGVKVAQMLSDYQSATNGGNGYLRKIIFDLDNSQIHIKTYSPYLGTYATGPSSQFDYTANFQSSSIQITGVIQTEPTKIPVSLTAASYTQDFDVSLGTGGTASPQGWYFYNLPGSNATYTATKPIDASGIAASALTWEQTLEVWNQTSTAKTFVVAANAGASASAMDRALATNPTSVGGKVIELYLSNDTGMSLAGGTVTYDLKLLSTPSKPEELPGYSFYYSLTGGATASEWRHVSQLDRSSAGTASFSLDFKLDFGASVGDGQPIYFRWADDNSLPSSPDATYALDNVSFTPIPLPAPSNLTWTGTINGTWDVNTTANFSGNSSSKFNDGDYVEFADTGSNSLPIEIADGGVTPGRLVFSNTAKNYSLSGGPIKGTTSLEISGGGQVTLSNANTYTGGTFITSGTLIVTKLDVLPPGQNLTIGSGGTVILQSGLSAAAVAVGQSQAVPEPSMVVLLSVGALSLLACAWRWTR